jgi:hypothetical protein
MGAINAKFGVHTPRSTTLAARASAAMDPLHEAHEHFMLNCRW